MKKYPIILTSLILILALAACGVDTAGAEKTNTGSLNTNYENALSAPAQLALGSIKLEDSDLAIDEEQAAQLLPLWQGYLSLFKSSTASDTEISALFKQIQSAMTTGQIEAISDMQLTDEDSAAYMEEMGTQLGGGLIVDSGSSALEDASGMGGGGMPDAGMGGGGMPDAGMSSIMGGGGVEPVEEESTTPMAEIESGDIANTLTQLVNALIQTFQTKMG